MKLCIFLILCIFLARKPGSGVTDGVSPTQVLGSEPMSSGRASALNCGAVLPTVLVPLHGGGGVYTAGHSFLPQDNGTGRDREAGACSWPISSQSSRVFVLAFSGTPSISTPLKRPL